MLFLAPTRLEAPGADLILFPIPHFFCLVILIRPGEAQGKRGIGGWLADDRSLVSRQMTILIGETSTTP